MKYYFINRKNQKLGPYNFEQLKEMQLQETDLIWTQDNTDWLPVNKFGELQPFIVLTPPPTKREIKRKDFVNNFKSWLWVAFAAGFLLGFVCLYKTNQKIGEINHSESVYNSAYWYNEERYYEEKETGLLQSISAPFRVLLTETEFYVTKKGILTFKLMFFSILDCCILYLVFFSLAHFSKQEEDGTEVEVFHRTNDGKLVRVVSKGTRIIGAKVWIEGNPVHNGAVQYSVEDNITVKLVVKDGAVVDMNSWEENTLFSWKK
ncbi:DUF4339 domain-containing protein [Niabella sp. CJ426]|uniref:DUF4339 domain-containing protein n=1 Tax=Niabella sp. CJ426 TaxID=3393740 RepID=UPI003CFC6502